MKVTLDIPEGYEAKIVPADSINNCNTPIFEFWLKAPNQDVADSIIIAVTPIFMRVGWCRLRLAHTSIPVGSDGKAKYIVVADSR